MAFSPKFKILLLNAHPISDLQLENFVQIIEPSFVFPAASSTDKEIATWEEALSAQPIDVTAITLAQWLNMWGRLCYGSAGMAGFPIWVQLLPKIFFEVIDHDGETRFTLMRRCYPFYAGPSVQFLRIINRGT